MPADAVAAVAEVLSTSTTLDLDDSKTRIKRKTVRHGHTPREVPSTH